MLEAWHVLTTCGTVAPQFQSSHLSPVDLRRPACLTFIVWFLCMPHIWLGLYQPHSRLRIPTLLQQLLQQPLHQQLPVTTITWNDVMDGWLQFPALLDGTCASSSCAWCLSTLKGDLISCAKESFSRKFGDPCRKGSNKLEGDGAQKESSVHEDYRIGVVSKKHQGQGVATNHKETEVLPQWALFDISLKFAAKKDFFSETVFLRSDWFFFWEWKILLKQSCTSASELISDKIVVACALQIWKHIGMCVETVLQTVASLHV